jgi:Ca2+-binding RTX toxin-like protein
MYSYSRKMIDPNKKILNWNSKKKFLIRNLICINLFVLCMFGSIFLIDFMIIFYQNGHNNIVNTVWATAKEINGTENADNITGTINKDIINGLNGNDTLAGKEAGDDISGGSGNDLIYGNEGRDVLKGKAGNDHIEGGEGRDRISGDRGNDVLIGGPDNDTLNGGYGKDIFICGDGTDTIIDFNITQKDVTPENDCENQKNEETNSIVPMNINKITDNKSNNVETAEENKKDDFFFGLFK